MDQLKNANASACESRAEEMAQASTRTCVQFSEFTILKKVTYDDMCLYSHGWGSRVRQIPRDHWLPSLVYLLSSRPKREPVSNNKMDGV